MLPLIHFNPFKWRMLIRFDYIIFNPNRHGPVEGFSQRMLGRDAPDSAGDAGCSGRILLLSHGIIRVGSGCAGRIAGGGGGRGERRWRRWRRRRPWRRFLSTACPWRGATCSARDVIYSADLTCD